MKRFIIWMITTVVAVVVWSAANFFVTTEGWTLKRLAPAGDVQAFERALTAQAQQQFKGNLIYALLSNGKQVAVQSMSKGKPVDEHSRFGVASLSKWVTATAVMVLVEQGKVNLDTPVSKYLTRWQLPPSEFDNEQVTLRRLLSHTAGITDGLGHNGFAPGEPVQPLVEHLTRANDADPGKSGKVQVGMAPGTKWMYSGGSYNIIQMIIEEVCGCSYAQAMQQLVFAPLGMISTDFTVKRDAPELATYFGANQQPRVYPNYTSLAATGLYTTVSDLIRFTRSQIPARVLDEPGTRLLTDNTLDTMRTPIAQVEGLDIWGAGVMLFAPTNSDDYVIGHGGQSPYLNASVRLNPDNGDAIIAMQTGNQEALASDLATHWTTWQTGKPDMYILNNSVPAMLLRIVVGSGVIMLLAITWGVVGYTRRSRRHPA
ncbi:serine hydrolase domain-containing protein [Alteromonas gilva]|uniref:Serine hydrolase n=1 Tax=Alteromonas gilva TaxID=2987522 RepID=A0ABT5L1N3_9ALTE|nr:serine hydrolase domain-containing protein [Alteromonas gilva]MDC8830937.1 serine hydrolase [Alteromonas gilva]